MRLALALALLAPVATVHAQKTLGNWDFNRCDSYSIYSKGQDDCVKGGRLSSHRKIGIMKENGSNNNCVLVLTTSGFPATSRTSSSYKSNAFFLTITPDDSTLSIKKLSMKVIRDQCSMIEGIDVFADELPGSGGDNFQTRIGTINLPRETSSTPNRRTVEFDLSGVAFLQGVTNTVSLRLNFSGEEGRNCRNTTTCIDDIQIEGDCQSCPKANVKVLGRPSCAPYSWLRLSSVPAFGTTPRAIISAPAHPGGKVYLFLSIGCGTGMKIPGTDCMLWMKGKPYLWGGDTLNSNGQTAFPLPIMQQYSKFAGVEVGLQALLWTNQGDGLSNGLCLRLGCL